MSSLLKFTKEDLKLLSKVLFVTLLVFSLFYTGYAYTQESESLTTTVQASLSFTATTNDFGNITPGTPIFATTTLNVTTNNADGWNIVLSGDDQGTGNTVMDLDSDASVGITDDTEWVPNAATSSAGNATSLTAGDDVLAFRVMSASSTNGGAFLSTAWWGTSDAQYNASQLWAGIPSSTVSRQIGNAGAGSYSASEHINTVVYYLDVPSSQQTGSYAGDLTYTATAN